MWPLQSDSLAVGVSTHELCWKLQRRNGLHESGSAALPLSENNRPLPLAGLAKRAGRNVRVIADASMSRHWVQSPAPGLRNLAELRQLVRSRCDQLYGDASGWRIEADWNGTRPFLCVAVRKAHLGPDGEASVQVLANAPLSTTLLVVIQRYWKHIPRDGWFSVCEPGSVHALHTVGGSLTSLRSEMVSSTIRVDDANARAIQHLRRSAALSGSMLAPRVTLIAVGSKPSDGADIEGVQAIQVNPPEGTDATAAFVACWIATNGQRGERT